ncbi:MAG: DUF5117 domain-containing protein [Phycisphaerales bacterium]|nr:MAG: DUF5117 domain-containing protein [Phycisphaerales bacterium]
MQTTPTPWIIAVAAGLTFAGAWEGARAQQIPPEAQAAMAAAAAQRGGANADKDRDFPPYEDVIKDHRKVISTADGAASMYTLFVRDSDSRVLAELPPNFESQRLFIATTIAGGSPTAGIQWGDLHARWKRYDKRLALIEPNLGVRSSGDLESKKSRDNLFTDRVILDVPIVTLSPRGAPVIDMTALLVRQSDKFFGAMVRGANMNLAKLTNSKAFPQNVEIAFEMPLANGRLTTLHYSWSVLPENTGYRPRVADPRVGYFTTTYRDLGQPGDEQPWTRYINRWHIEKADPKLRMSPPKQPIVFYIEHTTPVRYRRWVRDGILEWNKAFEQIGIINAIEVYQQDARTGAHMEKDPEDVRYNFYRWNSNSIGFAIGPSRVDPRTGQILDADIVMNDGFIRAYATQWRQLMPEIATDGFAPETLSWLEQRPEWDPRVLLAAPGDRERIMFDRTQRIGQGPTRHYDIRTHQPHERMLVGASSYDGLHSRVSQMNGGCSHAHFKAMDVAMLRLGVDMLDAMQIMDNGDDDVLDGVPERFIGPLIQDVTTHEVGHTLGLRHNFKASSIRSLEEINSPEMAGKPFVGSVMDYNPVNINFGDGPVQGDFISPGIGPYDFWAIEFGYTDGKLDEVLAKVADPDHVYLTDEDAWGPDPLARRFDLGSDPLDFAESRMRLVQDLRGKILDRAVKDGDSWEKARTAYLVLLGQHVNSVSIAANWVGGSHINRDRKGDPGGRRPIEDVPVEQQRRAMQFVIDNAFNEAAFGLTPELLSSMTVDKWWDEGGFGSIFEDPTWPVHDRIAAIQSSALTMLLNPTTLRRVHDNEFRVEASADALTLPEVLSGVTDAIWSEVDARSRGQYTPRQPMISSLRRNLQRAHLRRMIDLSMPGGMSGAAAHPVATLSTMKLRELHAKISRHVGADGAPVNTSIDPYTQAHLAEARLRIEKALDADFIYNTDALRFSGMPMMMMFGQEERD